MQAAQLIGTVPQGIEPELAVEDQVFKGFGERIQTKTAADRSVVFGTLARVEDRDIAADHDRFDHLWR
jgi:hypothetical protein